MFFVEITNFLPVTLLYHLTSSLQADNVANIYTIFIKFLLKVLKNVIKSSLTSHISLFFFQFGMFFQESCSPEYALFSLLFSSFTPPPQEQNLIIFILLYRLSLLSVFWIHLIV